MPKPSRLSHPQTGGPQSVDRLLIQTFRACNAAPGTLLVVSPASVSPLLDTELPKYSEDYISQLPLQIGIDKLLFSSVGRRDNYFLFSYFQRSCLSRASCIPLFPQARIWTFDYADKNNTLRMQGNKMERRRVPGP